MILPNDFVFEVGGVEYECRRINNEYHIWPLGEDYDECSRQAAVGVWNLDPVQAYIDRNIWHYLYSLEMPDEETVGDSLEEVL